MEKTNPVLAESQYPLPTTAQVLAVTPEMASDWLTHRTYNRNRKISKAASGKYLADMRSNRWKVARNAGIVFDTQGKILDGQHRLQAVANLDRAELEKMTGLPGILFWIYVDEPRDTFDVLDQGLKRQASQLLGVPNASQVAAGARYLAALADEDPWSLPRFTRVTNPEILSTVVAWPELARYASDVNLVRLATWITGAPHGAILAQAARTEHADKVPEWLRGLLTGDNLTGDDSRLKLRNRFMANHHLLSGSKNRDLVYAFITKAWNAYAKGESMPVLRHRVGDPLPLVTGFDWSKYNTQKES